MTIVFPSLFLSYASAVAPADSLLDPLAMLGQSTNPFLLASAVSDLKAKLEEVLNMIMLFGFLYGTIRIIGGAGQIRRGEIEEGKAAIVSGALIAAAPLIMRILFEIFFNSGSSLFGP